MLRRAFTILVGLACLCFGAAALAHPPYGIATDERGNVYFTDLEQVWRLGADGRLSLFRPRVPDTHVHELTIGPGGAIEGDQNHYDPSTQRFYTGLWRRTPDGRERMLVPMSEAPPSGFGIWQDRRGNRYSSHWPSNADRRTMLVRRTPEGRAEIVFAEGKAPRGAGTSVTSVGGMAFGADGSVFFADRNLLRRLGPDGKTTLLHRGPQGSILRGLAAVPDGRLFAADMGLKAVLAILPRGRVQTVYRTPAGWLPTGVAVAGGRLWALEAEDDPKRRSHRVRVIEVRNGKGRVVAMPGRASPQTAAEEPVRPVSGGWGAIAGGAMLAAAGTAYALRRARTRRLSRREAAAPGGSDPE